MFDALEQELVALKVALDPHAIPLLVGGGMGLYLRDRYVPTVRQRRYPVALPTRSTQDLDVFLTADLIVDADKMNHLRDVLLALGYQPEVRYFQFIKTIHLGEQERTVKIDLLASPPKEEDWENAKQHYAAEHDQPHLHRADEIRAQYFAEETDLGVLRLKENVLYQRHRDEFDVYIPDVLQDLRDLFVPDGT